MKKINVFFFYLIVFGSLLPKVSVTSIHGKMAKRHKIFDMFREQKR